MARIAIHFSYLELYKRICRRSISLSLRKQSQYATESWILRSTRTTQERWNNPKAKANATPLSSNFTSDTHTFYYDRAGPSYLYINHGDCSLIRLTVLRKFYFKHVARPLPFQIISRILAFCATRLTMLFLTDSRLAGSTALSFSKLGITRSASATVAANFSFGAPTNP